MSKILKAMKETAKGLENAGIMDATAMQEMEELWGTHEEVIELSSDEFAKLIHIYENPAPPTKSLKKARSEYKKRMRGGKIDEGREG